MAYTTIDDPSAQFQNKIFTGNATARALTFDGNSDLQPDLVWAKNRDEADGHVLTNSTRGVGKYLACDSDAAEVTSSDMFTAFGSDGFSVNTGANVNSNTEKMVVWGWKGNGGTTSAVAESGSGDGGINACTHQANDTAGFSIIKYTGHRGAGIGDNNHTNVTHGLSAAPTFVIIKNLETASDWIVLGAALAQFSGAFANRHLKLNDTSVRDGGDYVSNTAPSSDYVFVGNNDEVNKDGEEFIMYAWHDVQGFSKFGVYEGNGDADGPFVYCGFQPAWVLIKNINGANDEWHMIDNTRDPINQAAGGSYHKLFASGTNYESASVAIGVDFLSNGFKVRATDSGLNADTKIYCFMAFAEQPFVTSGGVPAVAR